MMRHRCVTALEQWGPTVAFAPACSRSGRSSSRGQEDDNLNEASTLDTADPRHIPWWRRVRSGLLLMALSTLLGLMAAAVVGLAVATTISLLDHALG